MIHFSKYKIKNIFQKMRHKMLFKKRNDMHYQYSNKNYY